MADVTFTMSANEAKAVRAFQKLIDKQRQTGEGARDAGRKSREAGEEGSRGFNSMTSSMGAAIAKTLGLVAVVNQLRNAYRLANEESKKTAEAGTITVESLQTAVAGAGDMPHFGKIEQTLRYMGGGAELLTMPERGAVYSGVRGSLPNAPLNEVLALTGEAMKARHVYGDVESTVRFGGVMGELAKTMPGTSRGDLGDVAQLLMAGAGKHGATLDKAAFKGVQQLGALGVSTEDSLGMLLASYETGQGARALSSYASYRQQQAEGRKGTLAPAAQTMLDEFTSGNYVQRVREAQTSDLLDREVVGAGQSTLIRSARVARRGEVAESLAEYDEAAEEMVYRGERAQSMADRRRAGAGPWMREYVYGPKHDVGHFVKNAGDTFAGNLREIDKQEARRFQVEAAAITRGGAALERAAGTLERAGREISGPELGSRSGDPGD
jgi:hypothetical protein